MMRKTSNVARDSRFKTSETIVPSPDAYISKSFTDLNRSLEKGHKFSHNPKLTYRNKNAEFPGPTNYEV